MQDHPEETAETPQDAPVVTRPRRGAMWWLGWALGAFCLAGAVAVAGLWIRLSQGPLDLPLAVQNRIEARLDEGMTASRVEIGAMALDLPEGGRAPVMEFRDVRLSDQGGAPRAAFPAVRVQIDAAPLLSGHVRPRRVEVAGAGLRLSRDSDGRLDLDLSGSEAPARVTVPDTMARLDAMFAAPVFASLEEVTARGLQLAMADEMTGQVMRIEDATARLTRGADRLALTVGGALSGSRDTRLDIAVLRSAGEGETEVAAVFRDLAARDLATASPALAWLDLMRAPISGRLAIGLADDGTVGDMEALLDIGPGRVSLADDGAPLGFERVAADMRYDPESRRLAFSSLILDAPDLRFAAEGHADVAADGTSFVTQMRLSGIEAQPEGLFGEPVAIDGATVDLRLSLAPRVRIELGQAVVHDGDFRLVARGDAEAREDGLALALDASLEETDIGTVLSYWPVSTAPATRRWLAEKVDAGRVEGVDVAIRAEPGEEPRRHLQLNFSGVEMRPLDDGPPVRGATGYLERDGTRLILRLDEGRIAAEGAGAVDLGGTLMTVADTRPHGPEAEFRIEGRGALEDVMRLLEGPPFRIFRDGDMTAGRIGTGEVTLTAEFRNRLMRRDRPARLPELDLRASAEIADFVSDTLVPGRRLTAERLDLELRPDRVSVSGRAEFAGVPMTGEWQRPLGPDAPRVSTVEARADVTRQGLARLGVPVPDWLMSGQGAAELRLEMAAGEAPQLEVESDLEGFSLAVPALGWRLGAGQTGRLAASLRLGPDPEVTGIALDAPGLELEGQATLAAGGGLGRLTAGRLRAGGWLDVSGALVGRGQGVPPAIEITGGTVDLRSMPSMERGNGASGPLTVRLDTLEVSRDLALTDLSGRFTTGGGLDGEFAADVNGEAPISGTVAPGAFGPDLRVVAPDGGAVLRAAGIFRTAYGGRMRLTLRAAEAPRSYDGALRIDGPRLRDAPAMAELLNLISVVGLLEQLGGEGINLGTVEARFRLSPERLTLSEGTALGPSLGISMDGVYDMARRRYEMQGVVSPLYMVNGLVGAFFAPRREGLFGFSYSLTGTPENANVSVNPLSILTPGIFREIFRRPPPELTELPAN